MLPEFPQFKKLELADRQEVEKITAPFAPYSDFNFVSMWSWDIHDDMQVCALNGNLAVRFTDYVTGQDPFYSFLGNNQVNHSIQQLLELSVSQELKPRLKMVPKDSIKNIDLTCFVVEEDTDHFDYIYSMEDLKNYAGHNYEAKRNFVKRFLTAYPEALTEIFDLQNPQMQQKVLDLYRVWADNKIKEGKQVDTEHEIRALRNFFEIFNQERFLAIGIFIKKILVACSIVEVLESDYIISHFFKANWSYVGVYPYLMKEGARVGLNLKNKHLFNFEQDLGISGLRKSKTLFRPKFFLKKFIIRPRAAKPVDVDKSFVLNS